ncbi:MAG: hypothetical protein KBT27_09085 [Prevotellaceae bacterium]|nr:hypothetical protein [Candidatus Faecinaster equi]
MKKFIISFMLVLTSIFTFAQSSDIIVLTSEYQKDVTFDSNHHAHFGDQTKFWPIKVIIDHSTKKLTIITNKITLRYAIYDSYNSTTKDGAPCVGYYIVDQDGDTGKFTFFLEKRGIWAVLDLGSWGIYYPEMTIH